MQAGGGGFAAAIKIFDIGFCAVVGFDAADHVVGAWSDWYEVCGYVQVEALAEFADEWESLCKMFFVEVADVEVDVG